MHFRENNPSRWNWLACGSVVLTFGLCAQFSIAESTESNSKAADALKASFAKYKAWKPTTTKPFRVSSADTLCGPNNRHWPGPHGDRYIHVYVSDNARDMFVDGIPKQGPFPEGTVIVKEKSLKDNGDKPVELGVMIKQKKGSSPKTGDWQYLFVDQEGTLATGKNLQNCADCHAKAKTDSVFGRE